MGTKTVDQYAEEIMVMIKEDIIAHPSMSEARTFSDLHDHIDANEYMIIADVPYDPDDETVMGFYIDVQDAVTRSLAQS